jgi:hypothetical protein
VTQHEKVLRLLIEAGEHGVSAHELVYTHGITRGAAVIFDLRNGEPAYEIDTIDEGTTPDGRSKLARYVLRPGPQGYPKPAPTGHPVEPEPLIQPLEGEYAGPGSPSWEALGEKLRKAREDVVAENHARASRYER